MAVNRSASSLNIALIVFVTLTFVMAVMSYLFFRQWADQAAKAQDSGKQLETMRGELNSANADIVTLREIIGAAEGKPVADIEGEKDALLDTVFAGFQGESRSLSGLVAWLRDEFRKKDDRIKQVEAEKAALESETAKRLETFQQEKAAAEKDRDAATLAQSTQADTFGKNWAGHEAEQKKLLDLKTAAEEKSRQLELVVDEIAKAERLLPPDQLKTFQAKQTPEDRLAVIFDELRDLQRAVARQHDLLATLRVADPALQKEVLEATPDDDRIDGFDGRVLAVDSGSRSVLVSTASTAGIRPGMVLFVYDPADPRPRIGERKATLEIVEVEGPTVARGTIRGESARNPILTGDAVATSLWTPGTSPELVIVGNVDIDRDGRSDADRLTALVERAGGRVVDAVSPTTDFVVNAGKPRSIGPEGAAPRGWRPEDARRLEKALDTARTFGIRVVDIPGLLDMMGLTPDAATAAALP